MECGGIEFVFLAMFGGVSGFHMTGLGALTDLESVSFSFCLPLMVLPHLDVEN